MKSFFFISCFLGILSSNIVTAQTGTSKVILENSKVKVTLFVSKPQGDVCGKGTHTHGPHLTVLLSDAEVEVTNADGKKIRQKAPAGTTFWSDGDKHNVVNVGSKEMTCQIIDLK